MEEEKKYDIKVAGHLFERAISYPHRQVVSESVKVLAIQVASEKVTNMVGTFLNEDSTGSLFKGAISYIYPLVVLKSLQLSAIQAVSEKVTDMVETFLNDGSDGFQIIRVTIFRNIPLI